MIRSSFICVFPFLSLILALPLSNSEDVQSVIFSIPFHETRYYLKYMENIRQIQTETQTDIQLFQMVIIKGKNDKLEEARRLVSQINTNLDQGIKQENNETNQVLKNTQEKMFKSEMTQNDNSTDDNLNLEDFYKSREYIQQNNYGRQPLHIACILKREDVVKKLIKNAANINAKSDDGRTALHISVLNGHLNLVEYLISKNAHINEQDNSGDTALIDAVRFGHAEIVKFLCSNKANIHIKNKNNNTALDIAREYKRTELLEILQKYA